VAILVDNTTGINSTHARAVAAALRAHGIVVAELRRQDMASGKVQNGGRT